VIQLASSIRNIGKPNAAVALPEATSFDDEIVVAAKAFLALAYLDSGNPEEGLSLVLSEFYPSGAIYERSIKSYIQQLSERANRKMA
jgi:hypothetical protein